MSLRRATVAGVETKLISKVLGDVRFTPERVAKHPLSEASNSDSFALAGSAGGLGHDGAARARARPVLL